MTEKELNTFLKGLEEILDNAWRWEYAVNKKLIKKSDVKKLIKMNWKSFDFKSK